MKIISAVIDERVPAACQHDDGKPAEDVTLPHVVGEGERCVCLVVDTVPHYTSVPSCDHVWNNGGMDPTYCLKCGMSFIRHIFTECP